MRSDESEELIMVTSAIFWLKGETTLKQASNTFEVNVKKSK